MNIKGIKSKITSEVSRLKTLQQYNTVKRKDPSRKKKKNKTKEMETYAKSTFPLVVLEYNVKNLQEFKIPSLEYFLSRKMAKAAMISKEEYVTK